MTFQELVQIVIQIDLGTVLYAHGWEFRTHTKGDGFLLQLVYEEADASEGADKHKLQPQHARKWYISSHATETEVVRTAYKAVLCSLEHRLGEHFRYKGVQVYDPHAPIEDRVARRDARKEPQ